MNLLGRTKYKTLAQNFFMVKWIKFLSNLFSIKGIVFFFSFYFKISGNSNT